MLRIATRKLEKDNKIGKIKRKPLAEKVSVSGLYRLEQPVTYRNHSRNFLGGMQGLDIQTLLSDITNNFYDVILQIPS